MERINSKRPSGCTAGSVERQAGQMLQRQAMISAAGGLVFSQLGKVLGNGRKMDLPEKCLILKDSFVA